MHIVLVNPDLSKGAYSVKKAYADALIDAGLTPLVVPASLGEVERLFGLASGVVLTGGADYPAELYGMEHSAGMKLLQPERAEFDLHLARTAIDRGLPALGICGGCQIINIACGGTLVRDIRREVNGYITHWKKPEEPDFFHPVEIEDGSTLKEWVGEDEIGVNSSHHQAVDRPGDGVGITARCVEDGVVEAIEVVRKGRPAAVGVQWHPERIYRDDSSSAKVFAGFSRWVRLGRPG